MMKFIKKILVATGIFCLFFGVVLFGVSMITGGDLQSVINHNVAMPYFDAAMKNVNGTYNVLVFFVNKAVAMFVA